MLGQWLRQRYNNYLNAVYSANDIYVRSSDVDRTLMSAQSVLAGLYPPKEYKIWNKNLLWQPIPVHTVPESMDHLLPSLLLNCTAYCDAHKRYEESDEMKAFDSNAQPFYDYISENSGSGFSKWMRSSVGLIAIRDSWVCETVHNLT